MNLHIEKVTDRNRSSILALKVKEEQSGFIESVSQCLSEADSLSLWRPVGIYDGESLVGFAMYGFFPSEGDLGRAWLDRFMIDASCQGKGYGKAALYQILSVIFEQYGCSGIFLSLYENNKGAERLYRKAGFVFTGEQDSNGEKIMLLEHISFG